MFDTPYPAVINAPHYQVWHDFDESIPVLHTGQIHRRYQDAEREMRRWKHVFGDDPLAYAAILTVEPVFLARCGECAAFPDDHVPMFIDWWDLCEYLTQYPGWMSTTERYVFCPHHLPSNEL